jgi:DNA-binding NtrC family response regulator
LNSDEKSNYYPLVRRPTNAVEKTSPGAKRILSRMVVDTLALTRNIQSPRIVCIDDEQHLLDLMAQVIKHHFSEATIVTFENSDAGWQELLRCDPDLLITDLVMPGINGLEILRRLVERKAAYPVLAISGYPPAENAVREYTEKFSNITFLRCPYGPQQLVQKVARLLGLQLRIRK